MSEQDWKKWLEERRYLWWWVPDVNQLDEEAIVEGVMNYGRWKDFLDLKKELGLRRLKQIFEYMTKKKKRVNLRPEKIALFSNYLQKYVAH